MDLNNKPQQTNIEELPLSQTRNKMQKTNFMKFWLPLEKKDGKKAELDALKVVEKCCQHCLKEAGTKK